MYGVMGETGIQPLGAVTPKSRAYLYVKTSKAESEAEAKQVKLRLVSCFCYAGHSVFLADHLSLRLVLE